MLRDLEEIIIIIIIIIVSFIIMSNLMHSLSVSLYLKTNFHSQNFLIKISNIPISPYLKPYIYN